MNTCEFCLLARIDPDLRTRTLSSRLNDGEELRIVEDINQCVSPKHHGVMIDVKRAFKEWNWREN